MLAVAPALAPRSAGAAPAPTDPVDVALARPQRLDSLEELSRLAEDTQGRRGTSVGVVVDRNGGDPGGISVERVVADRSDVPRLVDRAADIDGVVTAAPEVRVAALADPLVSLQYGPRTVGAPSLPAGLDGRGTTVAVIDTGVTASHADLAATLPDGRTRVAPGTTFLNGDPANGTPGTVDPNGHGTHVAGIVAAGRDDGVGGTGIAPGAQILPVRVLNSSGSGFSSDVTAAILWAHQQGADVINMSLGAPGTIPADVAAAIDLVTTDTSRGRAPTVVVASAGNYGVTSSPVWPALHPRVLAVAATDASDLVATYSSRGSYVDVAAPGTSILSTCANGGWCRMSGTSMASPLVAGAAAVLRQQDPRRGPEQVAAELRATAVDVDAPGDDVASGAGRIDLAAAAAAPVLPPPTPVVAPAPAPTPAPTPAPAPAPSPAPVAGGLEAVVVDRRTVVARGAADDPDGAPLVRVMDGHAGRIAVHDVTAAGGRWEQAWAAAPGTHHVCAVGYDVPTGDSVLLGCGQVVVK